MGRHQVLVVEVIVINHLCEGIEKSVPEGYHLASHCFPNDHKQ